MLAPVRGGLQRETERTYSEMYEEGIEPLRPKWRSRPSAGRPRRITRWAATHPALGFIAGLAVLAAWWALLTVTLGNTTPWPLWLALAVVTSVLTVRRCRRRVLESS